MLLITTNFYKKIFGYKEKLDIHLSEYFWEVGVLVESAKISQLFQRIFSHRILLNQPKSVSFSTSRTELSAPFLEEVIRQAIFCSYADGVRGSDGFPFLFYLKLWDLIKKDFIAMVRAFERNELDIARVNYVMLTFIPKENNVTMMKKFRPTALFNRSLKIFSKALNNILITIIDRLISPNLIVFRSCYPKREWLQLMRLFMKLLGKRKLASF